MDVLGLDPRRFGGYADRDYRIAKAIECFGLQFGVHYPYEERPAGRPGRRTPIHDSLAEQGAVFGAAYGWERPNWFAREGEARDAPLTFQRPSWFDAVAEECRAVAERVALADLSVFSKFEVTGPDATAFMENLGANRPPTRLGRIALIHALATSGGILSEFTVTRLAEDRYYLTSAAPAERQDHDLLRRHAARFPGAALTNLTTSQGVLALAGPRSRDLLAQLTDADLSNEVFPWLSGQEISVADIPVRALRVSYVGELGWELHHDLANQRALYETIAEAGHPLELGYFGAYAMNALRLEKGYRAWGLDLSTERTPIEAGLERFVRTEGRDFQGRKALAKTPELSLVLLELGEEGHDPFGLHPVFAGTEVVGLTTSGAYGHRVGKRLALAYVKPSALKEGLSVEIIGTRGPARVLPEAPYDPDNRKLRDS